MRSVVRAIAMCTALTLPLSALSQTQYQSQGTAAAAIGSQTIATRIARAHEGFASALEADPGRPIAALISFRTPKSAAEVVSDALAHGLRVQGFRHSDAAGSGGYTMKPGESIDQALARYNYDHRFFAQQQIVEQQRLLAQTDDPKIKEALREDLQLLTEREKSLGAGLQIVGVDLFGPAQVLSEYSNAHGYVRVVEVSTGTRINAAIRPQD